MALIALIGLSGPTTAAATTPPSTPTSAAPTSAAPTSHATASVSVSPTLLTVSEGGAATFRASPTGTGSISWQTASDGGSWRTLGATGRVLALTATRAQDDQRFRVVVTDGGSASTSTPVTLRVRAAPPPASVGTPKPTPAAGSTISSPAPTSTAAPDAPTQTATPPSTTTPPPPERPMVTPSGPRTSASNADLPADRPFGTVAATELPQGLDQTATAHGFTPGTQVRVTLEPGSVALGTHVVAADGTVTTGFSTIGLVAGLYTVDWTPV